MSGKAIIVEYDEFMEWFVPAPPREVEPIDLMKTVNLQGIATTPESRMSTQLVRAYALSFHVGRASHIDC